MKRVIRWTLLPFVAAAGAWSQAPPVVQPAGPEVSGPSVFEFSFSNPGARAMGLGGAFAALADDATAAFANPAGLVLLLRPEVAIEGRYWSFSTPYTVSGRVTGRPTGIGLDVTPGVVEARSSESTTDFSYLSFVYPHKRWAVALYRHQLANFEFRQRTQGLFANGPQGLVFRFWDLERSTRLDIVGTAIAGAFRVTEDLSLGLGVSYFDGMMLSEGGIYLTDDSSVDASYGENSYLPERLLADVPFTIDGTDWGVHGGVQWRISQRFRLGAFYRQGPRLDLAASIRAGPAGPEALGVPAGAELQSVRTPIAFPDVYGLGLAYSSRSGGLTLGFEWDRVEYSDIVEVRPSEAFDDPVILEDGNELRLGAEYVFRESTPILAVRLGVWLDPGHRIEFPGNDPVSRALFPPGEDELHETAGLGLVFKRFQIDLGMDFSDLVDTVSLSTVYSF